MSGCFAEPDAMPANLPPQYIKLEEEYRRERDNKRRLELLQQMLAEIPKHKGTDHLQGELKAKISKLKAQLEGARKSGAVRHTAPDHIPREGAGQFVLFGPPNGGKTSILGALTHAHVEVTEWPFGTRKPQPGMARWENVQLQLVDTPSIAPEFCETYVFNIIRTGDVAVLVVSLGDDDLLDELDYVVNRVHEGKVRLEGLVDPDPRWPTALARPTMIMATGLDRPDAMTRLELLRDRVGSGVSIWPVSIPERTGLSEFLGAGFASLHLIRVYSKAPGHPPDRDDPILLSPGATVADAARAIHKDFAEKLQYARIWTGTKSALEGQRVIADHVLQEGDVLEFHV
ncbi:MAG: GTPase [Candidatus Zixiibacteriota bacterium]